MFCGPGCERALSLAVSLRCAVGAGIGTSRGDVAALPVVWPFGGTFAFSGPLVPRIDQSISRIANATKARMMMAGYGLLAFMGPRYLLLYLTSPSFDISRELVASSSLLW